MAEVELKGIKALEVIADTLPRDIEKSDLKKIYRQALQITRDQMRANLPENRTGALWYATDVTISGDMRYAGGIYGIVGPRRKRGAYRQQGQHAHIIESGSKPHTIRNKYGKPMPVFRKGRLLGVYKAVEHPGTKPQRPFSRAIFSTWMRVSEYVTDHIAGVMRKNIKTSFVRFGNQGLSSAGFFESNVRRLGKDPNK